MNKLTKFVNKIFEGCKTSPLRLNGHKKYTMGGNKEEWQEFISRYEFDLFVTLTFREDIERSKADKRFEKWLGSFNCELFGWRYRRKGLGIRYAVAYEYQKRGTLHFHALLGAEGLKELNREHMAKLWKSNGQLDKKTGSLVDRIVNVHAEIDIYDPTRGAIKYMTKHLFKDGCFRQGHLAV
jgi:hypothetical protein